MSCTYTFDVFMSIDGFGSYDEDLGDWGGYWGKQGPELLARRLELVGSDQRMVLGARTFEQFVTLLDPDGPAPEADDAVGRRMRTMPTTVISSTLDERTAWDNATVLRGDAVDVVARLKEESEVPLRSHGSLSLNRALLAAGLVDRLQVTIFPALTGRSGTERVLEGDADLDLELLSSRTFDGAIQELVYHPTLRGRP